MSPAPLGVLSGPGPLALLVTLIGRVSPFPRVVGPPTAPMLCAPAPSGAISTVPGAIRAGRGGPHLHGARTWP